MCTFNCKGRLVTFERPAIMGILNYTDDSFYSGSRLTEREAVLAKARKMILEGADILDLGAQSTRPGSQRISAQEEIEKLLPIVSILVQESEILISIDTYHSEVADTLIKAGAQMINDISGGTMDDRMIETVGRLQVPYVCMHIRGTPENMQLHTHYDDILKEIITFFINQTEKCRLAGINDVIIDPGFGFAKNKDQNFFLLKNLSVFKMLERPLLAGLSRKSMIYKTLNTTPEEALNGTTALNMVALLEGADILRVHDVKEATEVVQLYTRIQAASQN